VQVLPYCIRLHFDFPTPFDLNTQWKKLMPPSNFIFCLSSFLKTLTLSMKQRDTGQVAVSGHLMLLSIASKAALKICSLCRVKRWRELSRRICFPFGYLRHFSPVYTLSFWEDFFSFKAWGITMTSAARSMMSCDLSRRDNWSCSWDIFCISWRGKE